MSITPFFSLGRVALPSGAWMAMLDGCESVTEEREHTLAAAGFRTIAPATKRQRLQLLSLPADRITPLRHGSQTVFIFPDPERNLLFVGRDTDFQRYRQLCLEQDIAEEDLAAAQFWSESGWGEWGSWEECWW